MRFEFNAIELDVDVERTRQYFADAPLLTDDCGCAGCRNYVQAAEQLPREVLDFFAALGLDVRKTPDVFVDEVYENGKLLYHGWYHLCGKFLRGKPESQNAVYKGYPDQWFQVTEGFRVGFHEDCALLPKDFPQPALQMEIDLRLVPWVLEEENGYTHLLIKEPRNP